MTETDVDIIIQRAKKEQNDLLKHNQNGCQLLAYFFIKILIDIEPTHVFKH